MSAMNHFDERVWSRFFDFVFPDERDLNREQVQEELKRAGVAMGPSLAKLAQVLEHRRESDEARAALVSARNRRLPLLVRLTGIEAPSGPVIREALGKMIAERFLGTQQAVYARKLQSASSDEDLRSLLEDISRLEAFSEDAKDEER